jgi:uncharacterized membrane protein SpoIIM required for sporulation
MLELLVFPKEGEKKPGVLFLVGFVYASLSYLLVHFVFGRDVVLSRYSGLLVAVFATLFSIIFVHYSMRLDEEEDLKDDEKDDIKSIMREWKILSMFLWLFLGFIVAFSFWQVVFSSSIAMNAQIETYCVLKNPMDYTTCFNQYNSTGIIKGIDTTPTGSFGAIFMNNLLVFIFIIIFSLLFGAGSIFIIAWNASIISVVIGLSVKYSLSNLAGGISKFMIHGIPEIAGYFIAAMAGGMVSFTLMGYLHNSITRDNLRKIIRHAAMFLLVGILVLALGALIEVFITPLFYLS